MKTILIKEQTEEDVAVVMIGWLAAKFQIKPEALASLIGLLRKDGAAGPSSEANVLSKPIDIEE